MNSVIEDIRLFHEDSDRLTNAVVYDLMQTPKNHLERLRRDHRINENVQKIMERNDHLCHLYEENINFISKECERIASASSDDLTEFYHRLKDVKDRNRRPVVDEIPLGNEESNTKVEELFSGEENLGKFLDLNNLHQQFINLKGITPIDYLTYIDHIGDFGVELIPETTKLSSAYKKYLVNLITYLQGFLVRSQPLIDLKIIENEADMMLEKQWHINVPEEDDQQQIVESLYCDVCEKVFSKQSVFNHHLTGRKHIVAAKQQKRPSNSQEAKTQQEIKKRSTLDQKKQLSRLEILSRLYLDAVSREISDTRASVERKMTLTFEEYTNRVNEELENLRDKADVIEGKSNADKFYNPLNLPIGWDGKPIPFWLYKLHGLGIEFPCEICGNFVYMGRKAFQRHFKETRHAQGMRNLGIPNTFEFREITKIADALTLWAKIRETSAVEQVKAEDMEEFEDTNGNIYNKKTFEDLRRQGLL